MVVPNYVPDPVEIPGNVTEEPYAVRLAFLRRVIVLHLVSGAAVGALAMVRTDVPLGTSLAVLAATLLALSFVRVALRGSPLEWVASTGILPLLLGSLGLALGQLRLAGAPVWAMGIGLLCAAGYGLLCGRDFSFVGQWVLALLVSTAAILGLSIVQGLAAGAIGVALLINALYLSFYVYDLACLLSRRRLGEELGAVADLYRDVLNFFGYVVRVIHHWRKHRIFALRSP